MTDDSNDMTLGTGEGGAVYVFRRQGASRGDPAKPTGDEGAFGGNFGVSVSIDGDRLIAGSPYVSNASGAAFVFRLVESAWVREARLVPACSLEWGRFGSSVSISGDYAAVGNNGDAECGVEAAAFFFHYSGAAWEEQARIGSGAARAGYSFGESVSIRGATAAAAEPDVWNDVGAVCLFERDGPQWTAPEAADPGEGEGEESEVQPEDPTSSGTFAKLTPGDGQDADRFGDSIDLDGGHAIVGAPSDDDNGSYSGSAYIYPLFFVRISVDPPYVQTGGEASATLSWTSRGADEVRIEPDIGTVSATGSLTIYPYETTTYTITATRDGASITDTATITAIDPSAEPTVALSATPESIVRGEPALLSWASSNVDSVVLDNGIGDAPPTGSMVVHPAETTAYAATASNESGTTTAIVTITVVDPPPEASLSAEPSEIEQGETSILSWTSSNAETLTIEPDIGTVDQNGSRTISPAQTTTYTLAASGPGGDATSTATVEVRLPNPFTLQITYPADGSQIAGSAVSVKGAIVHENGLETAVVVNGVLAIVAEGQFIADNVPLFQGENILSVAATDDAGFTKLESATVYADESASHIRLVVDPVWGVPPFETTLRIEANFGIVSSQMSYVGPDPIETLESGIGEFRIRIPAKGLYTIMVDAADEAGNSYESDATVEALDETALDTLLRSKWDGMKAALIAGDISAALEFHQPDTWERYGTVYNALGDHLYTLVENMREISPVFFEGARAQYRILRDHEIEGQTVAITYYIYFSRDMNGIWKIDKY